MGRSNHHVSPLFGRICFGTFSFCIKQANPSVFTYIYPLNYPNPSIEPLHKRPLLYFLERIHVVKLECVAPLKFPKDKFGCSHGSATVDD